MTGFTRRTMVGGLALAGLAGCTGLRNGGGGSGGAVFDDVGVDGTSLVVSLAGSAEVDSVTIVSPDGSEFASRSVGAGVSKLSINLGLPYSPGEHTVVAAREGSSIGKESIKIRPEVEIVNFGVGSNYLEKMPDGMGTTKGEEAWIRFENNGNGPEKIEKLLILGDVPNPTTDIKQADDEGTVSGIYNPSDEYVEYDAITLGGGEARTVFTSSLPFSYQGDGVDCKSTAKSGDFRVVGTSVVSSEDVSKSYDIQYTPSPESDHCEIDLGGSQ